MSRLRGIATNISFRSQEGGEDNAIAFPLARRVARGFIIIKFLLDVPNKYSDQIFPSSRS